MDSIISTSTRILLEALNSTITNTDNTTMIDNITSTNFDDFYIDEESSSIGTCDICGWIAAFGSTIAFGTFGAPIKSKTAKSVDIDPLVFQSYKTFMCFTTSWLVLLFGVPFSFTPWGIISGIFWVPGGVATIYAVKNAGLAIAIGVLGSFIVLVSFTWGIFIFDEHVHSRQGACSAVGCMIFGLVGMAYYSQPTSTVATTTIANDDHDGVEYHGLNREDTSDTLNDDDDDDDETQQDDDDDDDDENNTNQDPLRTRNTKARKTNNNNIVASSDEDDHNQSSNRSIGDDDEIDVEENPIHGGNTSIPSSSSPPPEQLHKVICGMKFKRRTLGILSAVFCGVWGGSIMVPMQYAPKEDVGIGYLLSFSIGASIVTICAWILRYMYMICYHKGSFVAAYYSLPSFHLRKMWLLGGTSGFLWSIGNFCSLFSVKYLGEGVGYSVTQSSMLVSGLWGIFYFHEVQGADKISMWFVAASITVFGIIWLSYEHHAE